MGTMTKKGLERNDDRVIIHFDYDCFYAAVFEVEDPSLRSLPLAVQQKQIIVTCNYEARRRGLYKLQLVTSAKQACPDLIIILGEDLTRFRDASKALYNYLSEYAWSRRVDRLGFDEVFIDVTDMIEFNLDLLNFYDLQNSYFHLSRTDPTIGFSYDASTVWGHTYPTTEGGILSPAVTSPRSATGSKDDPLYIRLLLGSHLAQYLRHKLEEEKGFTSTVGISTCKLLSKLVGNVNKPNGQTTLIPPYVTRQEGEESNVTRFLDPHDVGKIPGIGFKLSQKIRAHVLGRPAHSGTDLVYGVTQENVSVRDVRVFPGMGAELLEKLLGGTGSPQGIGLKVWGLLNGVDQTEVGLARKVPRQISLEDSYIRLDTLDQAKKELLMLSRSLIKRMHLDLVEDDDDDENEDRNGDRLADHEDHQGNQADLLNIPDPKHPKSKRWIAHPRTLRLSTRARAPLSPDGTRPRSFNRTSRSTAMPNFIFSLSENDEALAERLVKEVLLPHFRKLHPEKTGWNLSLVNVAATNMVESAGADFRRDKTGADKGANRNIGRMFRTQERVLKEWRVEDRDVAPDSTDNDINNSNLNVGADHVLDPARPSDSTHPTHHHRDHLNLNLQHGSASPPNKSNLPNEVVAEEMWHEEEPNEVAGPRSPNNFADPSSSSPSPSPSNKTPCPVCGTPMPAFAMAAHERYHAMGEEEEEEEL
ncbi:MAG: hypothetical protein M1837_005506 [Sclerophora amabilis]|nr:MAG: hypothetical protein M1837_005506 [Sclerophora amabilis]